MSDRSIRLQLPGWEGRWGSSELIVKLLSVSDTKSLHAFSPPPERDTKGKILCVFQGIGKFILLLAFLYFFVCSLDVLSSAFQLVGGMDGRGQRSGLGVVFSLNLVWKVTAQQAPSSCSLLEYFRTGSHLRSSCEVMPPFYRKENWGPWKSYDWLAEVA